MNIKNKTNSLIFQGSQLLNIDLHYFLRGGFWLSLNQLLSGAAGFILSILYSRYISKFTYGQYVYVLSFVSLFSCLALPGMNTAIVRAVAQGREKIFRIASHKTFPWSIFASLPLLFIAGYYLIKPSPDLTLVLAFLICSFLVIPIWAFRFTNFFLVGKTQFKLLFKFLLLQKILNLLFMGTVIFLSPNLLPLLTVSLIVEAAFNTGVSFYFYKKLNSRKPQKADFDFAHKLNDVRIINNFGMFLDNIIIGKFLGFEMIAIYNFAQIFPEQIKTLIGNFATLSLPKLSTTDLKGKKEKFYFRLSLLFISIVVIVTLYILLAPILFSWFFPNYQDSILFSRILSLSVISSPLLVIVSLFESQAKTNLLRLHTYPTVLIRITLLILLTLKLELLGTTIAIVVSRLLSFALALLLLKKRVHF